MSIDMLLYIVALLCFLAHSIGQPTRVTVNLQSIGLALLTVSLLV